MEIIDFHTHPFLDMGTNICNHREYFDMSAKESMEYLKGMGISKICGSVISLSDLGQNGFHVIREKNNIMLELKKLYGDFYVPGFHVHPFYIKESLEEMERMHKLGINLIGEIVPYMYGWEDYSSKGFCEILDLAEYYKMVVSIHSMGDDQMDKMVKEHKNVVIIAAHPGEYERYMRHLERMKISDNYHLDISGTGLFRHGMLKRGINACGVERFIFGSDYPICNPAMFIGGVTLDSLLSDNEKEAVLSGNIKRLLNLE